MDGKDKDKMVMVIKPVASRPSNIRLLSVILNNTLVASPSTSSAEATIAIRPKTLKLEHSLLFPSSRAVPAQDDASEPVVIYRPKAKLVSRTTAAQLANVGNFSHKSSAEMKTHFQVPASSNNHDNFPLNRGMDQTKELSSTVPLNVEQEKGARREPENADRLSYDGYRWRKYGQKQLKGSQYPRSYYKCSHPKCTVKKKVERSLDGKLAEIVYEGDHYHPKPQRPKRISSESQLQQSHSGDLSCINHLMETNTLSPDSNISDIDKEVGLSGIPDYTVVAQTHNSGTETNISGAPLTGAFGFGLRSAGAEPNEKKRKIWDQAEAGTAEPEASEPQLVAQSLTQSDVSGDGFHWRKYGQKVVKGNAYPRNYYKCSNPERNARKHIEGASDDRGSFITTYEGKHSHENPAKKLNPSSST